MSQKKQVPEETAKTHLVRSLKLAEESKQIGVNTLTKLDEQTEQLRRVRGDAEDTEHIIKGNRKVVRDMRRFWFIRLCCYNRNDMLPPPPTWENRDTPEEQMKIKKMIKIEKRRRLLRRKHNGDPNSQQPPDDPSSSSQSHNKSSTWKFWKSSKDEDISDLSDISELSDDPAGTAPLQLANPILPTNKYKVPKVEIDENIDEDTALDQLESTVQDLKVIAMQISETSKYQTSMLGGITDQVNTNRDQLDRNQKLVGKLGRNAKDEGDDGMLSASDRLAILGVKSAITQRMQ